MIKSAFDKLAASMRSLFANQILIDIQIYSRNRTSSHLIRAVRCRLSAIVLFFVVDVRQSVIVFELKSIVTSRDNVESLDFHVVTMSAQLKVDCRWPPFLAAALDQLLLARIVDGITRGGQVSTFLTCQATRCAHGDLEHSNDREDCAQNERSVETDTLDQRQNVEIQGKSLFKSRRQLIECNLKPKHRYGEMREPVDVRHIADI